MAQESQTQKPKAKPLLPELVTVKHRHSAAEPFVLATQCTPYTPKSSLVTFCAPIAAHHLMPGQHVHLQPGEKSDQRFTDYLLSGDGLGLTYRGLSGMVMCEGIAADNFLICVCGTPSNPTPEQRQAAINRMLKLGIANRAQHMIFPISQIPDFSSLAFEFGTMQLRVKGFPFLRAAQESLVRLSRQEWSEGQKLFLDQTLRTHIAPALGQALYNDIVEANGVFYWDAKHVPFTSPWVSKAQWGGLLKILAKVPPARRAACAREMLIAMIEDRWDRMKERHLLPLGEVSQLRRAFVRVEFAHSAYSHPKFIV